MGYTTEVLNEVRSQLAPRQDAIDEARERRRIVKDAAMSFPGAMRPFNSGSLAHATANCPVHRRDQGLDADCGIVLDRRTYRELGPDGGGIGPNAIVQLMVDHITGKVQAEYPAARLRVTKRAILITFHSPLANREDPSVDLVVSLSRRLANGLWIPDTERRRWDPSDPEEHTRLLTAEPKALRVTRARAIRLAKAENKRNENVPLCSFNLEAFGLMFVQGGQGVPAALLTMWERGAADLQRQLTPDPAGVSAPIKVQDVDYAIRRLEAAAGHLRGALDHDDDAHQVRTELQHLWPEFVSSTSGTLSKAQTIAKIAAGATLKVTTGGGFAAATGMPIKNTRSYGDPHN